MERKTGFLLVLFLAAAFSIPALAQKVATVAGGFIGDGKVATEASFETPIGMTQDASGNIYVAEEGEQRVRKISAAGVISAYAGTGICGYNGDGGQARQAQVCTPAGMTIDPAGNLVFADAGNDRVRRITAAGIISTIAGTGVVGYTGDGGPATSATLNIPLWVTYDAAGNLYISDVYNSVVRKVDTAGIISTFAGNGTAGFCGDGGQATQACLNVPKGLAVDLQGTVYVTDSGNRRIRAVSPSGVIRTVAGSGASGFSGDGGPATLAAIGNPKGLAVSGGVLYISNAGSARIRNVTLSAGIINTFIGSTLGYDGDNHGPLATQLYGPSAIKALPNGGMLFLDVGNARVRRLSAGIVTTVAGGYIGDGSFATAAALVQPQGVGFDKAGNLYVVEWSGHRVRKVDTSGKITTVAGTGVSGYSGDGGPATAAQLYLPQAVVVDGAGNLYISDTGNNVIREVDASTHIIKTFSADPNFGGGLAFLAIDPSGSLNVGDGGACVVWRLDSAGNATAAAGVPYNCGYNGDNIPATTAFLNFPYGVAFDTAGNLYIGDAGNSRVRQVNTSGTIMTFAGDGTACAGGATACGDGGAATLAQLNTPLGLAFSKGHLYITDEVDERVRQVSGGVITTIAGTGYGGYNGNNLPALSTNIDDPIDLAVNPVTGVVYLVDDVVARVRKIQ